MNLRSWLIIVGIIAMSILNAFLISDEHIEISVEKDVVGDYEDRYGDLIYAEEEREGNLKKFGLDEATTKKTIRQMEKWKRYTKSFRARLKEAEEIDLNHL